MLACVITMHNYAFVHDINLRCYADDGNDYRHREAMIIGRALIQPLSHLGRWTD